MAYKDPGFHWGLFLPALFCLILAMIGIPLNASVCWVTIKHRSSLRYNTCILIAMEAFFRILHQSGHFHFFVIAASGINFYPLQLAHSIQSYSILGALFGINQITLLSFDRLFSLMAPLYYRQLNQRIYIFCHLLVNSAITAFYSTLLIESAKILPEWPCTGHIADLFDIPSLGPVFWFIGLAMLCASILAYLLVGIIVRLKLAKLADPIEIPPQSTPKQFNLRGKKERAIQCEMSVDKNNATTLTKWMKNREIGTQMDQQQFLAAKALPTAQLNKELAENHRLRIENAKLTLEIRRLRQALNLDQEVTTEKQQKIYHCLLLIVFITVLANFFYLFVRIIYKFSLLPLTPLQFWYTNFFTCGFFLNIGIMSNGPILYFNSVDYRKAYEKEFKKSIQMFKIICRRQEQSTIKITPISNHIIIK